MNMLELERLSTESERQAEGLLDQSKVLTSRYATDNMHSMTRRLSSVSAFSGVVRLLDWVVIIAIFVIASTMGNWLLPNTRPFPLPSYLFPHDQGSNINTLVSGIPTMFPYPHGKSTVPYAVVMVLSLAVPLLLIAFIIVYLAHLPLTSGNSTSSAGYRFRFQLANIYILGLLLSLALTLFTTDLLKNVIAKQRPDFWGRCGGVVQDSEIVEKYTLHDYGMSNSGTRMVTWEVCESYYNDVAKPDGEGGVKRVSRGTLQDGWRSFPSGHASIAFAGLGYFSLFLAHAFGVLGGKVIRRRSILVLTASIIPVLGAAYISASRYGDFMHGGIDICAGVIIGVLGMMVGWNWYAIEAQALLETKNRCLASEEGKGHLPVEEDNKAMENRVIVRVESADDIRVL